MNIRERSFHLVLIWMKAGRRKEELKEGVGGGRRQSKSGGECAKER